jgi:hypothetical protein
VERDGCKRVARVRIVDYDHGGGMVSATSMTLFANKGVVMRHLDWCKEELTKLDANDMQSCVERATE